MAGRADAAGHLLSAPEARAWGIRSSAKQGGMPYTTVLPGPSRTPDGAIRCREVAAGHRWRGNSRRSPPIRHLRPNTGTVSCNSLGTSSRPPYHCWYRADTHRRNSRQQPTRPRRRRNVHRGSPTTTAPDSRAGRPHRTARAARLRRSRAGGARRALGLPRHPRLPAARAHAHRPAHGRLHIGEQTILPADPVRERLAAYLDHRARRWPATANPHRFVNDQKPRPHQAGHALVDPQTARHVPAGDPPGPDPRRGTRQSRRRPPRLRPVRPLDRRRLPLYRHSRRARSHRAPAVTPQQRICATPPFVETIEAK
jgi:hypothetical protein